ncbi:MAG TPA: TonB family protein [Acidobacteriaceae bacterium]|nr:TonB family protein [Acidobacteriaceae bacterium]
MKFLRLLAILLFLPLAAVPLSFAWGSKGHTMINHLAVEALPDSVPAFLRSPAAIDEITYLGPEPDRWRSPAEPELDAAQAPDHFIDLELADLLGTLPRERYQYIAALYAYGLTHPKLASEMQPDRIGFQPYITEEVWERLKSAMRDYRQLSAARQDTRPVEAAIIFYAGWLGHYVGDGSQPLHTTIEYNGWVGPNPNGYTTDHQIHWQFETRFVNDAINISDVQPLMTPLQPIGDEWTDYLAYLRHTNSYVDEVYQLYKEHGFDGTGTPESRHFTAERLAAGASMLRDLIVAAWVKSAEPVPEWHHEEVKPAATSGSEPAAGAGSLHTTASETPASTGGPKTKSDPEFGTIYVPGNGVTDPKLIFAADPEYSDIARRRNVSGIVVISAIVGTDGHAHEVQVVQSLGWGLDETAVKAVRQYRFRPATYHGKPVAIKIKIEVNFGSY